MIIGGIASHQKSGAVFGGRIFSRDFRSWPRTLARDASIGYGRATSRYSTLTCLCTESRDVCESPGIPGHLQRPRSSASWQPFFFLKFVFFFFLPPIFTLVYGGDFRVSFICSMAIRVESSTGRASTKCDVRPTHWRPKWSEWFFFCFSSPVFQRGRK